MQLNDFLDSENISEKLRSFEKVNVDDELLSLFPHEVVKRLRTSAKVWSDDFGQGDHKIQRCTLFSQADFHSLRGDHRHRQLELESLFVNGITSGPAYELFANGVLCSNGETHRRRRKPLVSLLKPDNVEAFRQSIRSLMEEYLYALISRSKSEDVHVLGEFASKLPILVLCTILDVPAGQIDKTDNYVRSAAHSLRNFIPSQIEEINQNTKDLMPG